MYPFVVEPTSSVHCGILKTVVNWVMLKYGGQNVFSPHFDENYLRVVFGLLYLSAMEGI